MWPSEEMGHAESRVVLITGGCFSEERLEAEYLDVADKAASELLLEVGTNSADSVV